MERNLFLAIALSLTACSDVNDPTDTAGPQEVITTVVLTFSPVAGGDPQVFQWADPENDGSPVIDNIVLSDAEDYNLSVMFLNELESPAEDITVEVDAENDQHQLFFLGSAVDGPATGDNASAVVTHAYDDADANGFPVGLANTITTIGPGSGAFEVILRHLPPVDGTAVKTGSLAEELASGGIASLPGDTDVEVTFDLTVE